ncbi:50S ribosomal protein L11 methyltransferase [Puniceicoccus vermicola]|uniref:50S ribosomal protein L11 methyltransferase n=1 Tax=Puniceicoccus vermicola TaxID=388746 RepID=A0A7X1E4U1_9BACT|nr:50S ribosomal protein L11 methyltransferase [Puniceicoccus vermicola]MBC2602373.1 50S ribosomal protein L11 methyltransferase [Puniceicoccus vermicola]
MIKLSASILPDLVQPLEDFFCEALSPWSIVHPRPEDEVTLHGYFEDEEIGRDAWAELRQEFSDLPEDPTCETVRDEDWMESYKHHLRPWSYGRLQWVPEWERETFESPDDSAVVYLDSGLAFGTGSHETTRLCAQALVEFEKEKGSGGSVIDAGCGSGILALSAVKLGFADVHAFDNDPEAVRVTRENAEANSEEKGLSIVEAGIEEGMTDRTCDLLLANIQSNILNIYAEELVNGVRESGWLALSGILAHEAEKVAEVFQAAANKIWGEKLNPTIRRDGEWSLVLFQRA